MSTTVKEIKMLEELNQDSLSEAGGKGANLGTLINAGILVPPGFVVTTHAYRAHLKESGLRQRILKRIENLDGDIDAISEASDDISSWIEDAPMPYHVQREISQAYDHLAKTKLNSHVSVAVRSSATVEDLPSASFAGQLETFLGIHGKYNLFLYVKKCWSSMWSPQAISYRISMNFDHMKVDLAVVIQEMIAADVAGVMFTANPINSNENEMMISAGYGLGESVVSGVITPDTFILEEDGKVKEKTLGSKERKIMLTEEGTITKEVAKSEQEAYCLDANDLIQLRDLAKLVEKQYGSYMDTEWALAKGKIYMLQARPITTMNPEPGDLNILGPDDKILFQGKTGDFWIHRLMEHHPYPLKPLDFACLTHFYDGTNTFFHDMGFEEPKEQNKPIERANGIVALDYHAPGLPSSETKEAPKSFKAIDELWKKFSKEINVWIESMETKTINSKDVNEMVCLLEQAMKEYGEFVYQRFFVIDLPGSITEKEFNRFIKKAVGEKGTEELKEHLMRALPCSTVRQNQALMSVAQAETVNGRNSQDFRGALKTFLNEYGDRSSIGSGRMISPPTWREDPTLANEIIDALSNDPDIRHSEESFRMLEGDYEAAKEFVKERLNPEEWGQFTEVLEKARHSVIVREESVFYLEKLTGCIHRMALKLGNLLVEQKTIDNAGDVFFIFLEELESVVEGKKNIQERIEKRKKAFARVTSAHEKGVHWLISTGSIPASEANQEKKYTNDSSHSIKGSAASSGVYEGPVRIIKRSSDFNKLKKGDILVSPYTAPTWTPLFKVASAVVTEIGSAGSHAAIVAREYGIPCVVAIEEATNRLRDGQKIRVDGSEGVITILD